MRKTEITINIYSNDCHEVDLMAAKISVQKFKQKQNACMFIKISPIRHITRCKMGQEIRSWNRGW